MDIGIIGSGIVGTTLGTALVGKGHAVLAGTRDEGKLREWAEKAGGRYLALWVRLYGKLSIPGFNIHVVT